MGRRKLNLASAQTRSSPQRCNPTLVCAPLVILPNDTQLTMQVEGNPIYAYPRVISNAETDVILWESDYHEWPYTQHTTQEGAQSFSYELLQSPPGSFTHWHEMAGPLRYATYQRDHAHLTTSISTRLPQVSCPHPPWRFVAIQSARHAGIDLMSSRINF